jgi:hypothetical protein
VLNCKGEELQETIDLGPRLIRESRPVARRRASKAARGGSTEVSKWDRSMHFDIDSALGDTINQYEQHFSTTTFRWWVGQSLRF